MIKVGAETIVAISVYVEEKTSEEDVELGHAVAKIDEVIQGSQKGIDRKGGDSGHRRL